MYKSMMAVFDYLNRKLPFLLHGAILMTALSCLLHPTATIICGRIFESLVSYSSGLIASTEMSKQISFWCISLVILGCLAWIIEFGFLSLWISCGERKAKDVREKTYLTLINQDMMFYNLKKFGFESLLGRLETQIREYQLGASQPTGFIVYEIFSFISSLAVAFYHAWQLALLILGIFPLMVIAFWFMSRMLESTIREQQKYLMESSKNANTSIRESRTVKAYLAQDFELWQYKKNLDLVAKSYRIQARINALQVAMTKFIIAICYIAGFWLGLYMVIRGQNPGDIIIAFYTTLSVMQSIEIVSTQWIFVTRGLSAKNAISSLLVDSQTLKTHQNRRYTLLPNMADSDIEFRKVSFSYPGDPNRFALSNISLSFPARKKTFIVGRSGSGKSTIGMLIMNFFAVTKGDVLIGGNSIEKMPLEWLYENITLIDQEALLFNESIYQNIAFGRIDSASKEDVINACKVADLDTLLENLSDGLDNLVTQCGKSLSRGQRQRVLLSRARLRDSPVLILDEATCALDQFNRNLLNNEIHKWRNQKTTIIITHDVSQILDDEYIYVIEKGCVAQKGFRKELIEENHGIFASLLTSSEQIVPEPTQLISEKSNNLITRSQRAKETDTCESMLSNSQHESEASNERLRIKINNNFSDISSNIVMLTPESSSTREFEPLIYDSDQENEYDFLKKVKGFPNQISKWWGNARKTKLYSALPDNKAGIRERGSLSLVELSSNINCNSNTGKGQNRFSDKFELQPEDILSDDLKNQKLHRIVLTLIWPRLSRKNRIYLVTGIVASIFTATATPVFAYFISNLMKVYKSSANQLEEGTQWATMLLGLTFIDCLSAYYSSYCFEHVAIECITTLRLECLQNILTRPQVWLDDERNSSSLLAQYLDRNAEEMRNLIGRFMAPVFITLWLLSISIFWSLILDWKVTLAALSFIPLICAGGAGFDWTTSKCEEKCNDMAEKTSRIFLETMRNIRAIRTLRLEFFFVKKYRSAVVLTYTVGLRRSVYSGMAYGFVSDSTSFMITAFVFYFSVKLIIRNSLSMFACFQIINLLFFSLKHGLSTMSLIPQINSSREATTKISFLASLAQNQGHEGNGIRRLISPFPLVLRDLNFTYPNSNHKALSKINLTINKGSFIVITGSSGSGKSTLASLLIGLYPPDESLHPSLSYAGVPSDQCHIPTIRSSIAIVPQDPVIFPDTIFANIAYGVPKELHPANINAVRQAAEDAGIVEFIDSFEKGLDTIIGEGGLGVSRGQAQRIMIARALFRSPQLLIMDEPTSSLDTNSATHFHHTIRKIRQFRSSNQVTLLIISHKIELMALSDHIVVLCNGEIVERGDFQQLYNRPNGALWNVTGGKTMENRDRLKLSQRLHIEENSQLKNEF